MSKSNYSRKGFNKNFSINYQRFSRAVTRFLNRIVYDPDISEELSQDVFLKIYEKRIYLDPDSPRTINFLFAVAKNAAIDYLRRKRAEEDKIRSMHLEEAIMDRRFYEDIENAHLRGEVISTLSDVINSFPKKKRKMFIEMNFKSRNCASVARDAGISPYFVKKIEDEVSLKILADLKQYFEQDG
ncbi:MAG: hypothetical protein A2176_07235 [Spirochaetes bacterium RBG_13_51_14]|nr:MAG: hypothetical protein A2176_07235 [Spirochaetes bacterium RBG_13_51_14]